MLELQSLQKEQQRHEQLLKIQQDDGCAIEVTVPLRKVAIRSGTNQNDDHDHSANGNDAAHRFNNNRDSFHFENDANDDDIGTTVADDIVLVKGDQNNGSTLTHHANHVENVDTRAATITVNRQHCTSFRSQQKTNRVILCSWFSFYSNLAPKFGHRFRRWFRHKFNVNR